MEFILACVGLGCCVIGGIIVAHHKYKHSNEEDAQNLLPPDEQWFQNKDVCVNRCTHENWVIFFIVVGSVCACASVILVIVKVSNGQQ